MTSVFIDHINLAAPKTLLEELKVFYCDLLGLNTGWRPEGPVAGYWLYHGSQALLHLSENPAGSRATESECIDHVAFSVTGLDMFLKRLAKMELPYRRYYSDSTGRTQLFVVDPAGNKVELVFVAGNAEDAEY